MSDAADVSQFNYVLSLPTTLDTVWQLLTRGVADRRAPERHPTLATNGLDGVPQLRTVVLRAVDRKAAVVDVHTDLQSAKVSELQADGRCGLHVWNQRKKLQMRLTCQAAILSGDLVTDIWAKVPEGSRSAYGGNPFPGDVIASPDQFATNPVAERFAVLRLEAQKIETLCLAPDRHYRAHFLRSDDWAGQWLAP
ncbi:MAG: pyridoxamine 5'-phosphate oxidase family protein [Pseudomonadota bacterium]